MSATFGQTTALKKRDRALEHLALALSDRGVRRVGFASVTPDGAHVAFHYARISAAAGARMVYLSFVDYGPGHAAGLGAWKVSGAGQLDSPQSQSEQADLVSIAWQPESEANGSGLIAEPSRLRAALERDFGAYDALVCNLPPLVGAASGAPSPLTISKACDGLVLIVTAMTDKLNTVADAVEDIRRAGVNLLGTVLDERHVTPDKPIRLGRPPTSPI